MPGKIGKPMPVKNQTEADPVKSGEAKDTGMPETQTPKFDIPDHISKITEKGQTRTYER